MCKDSVSVFVVNLFDNVQPKKNKTKSQRAASLWFLTWVWFAHSDFSITYPEFILIIESVKQLDNVAVVTFSQDVNLDDVIFQLFLRFGLDHFGSSQNSCLLVSGLWKENRSMLNETCMSNGRPFLIQFTPVFVLKDFQSKINQPCEFKCFRSPERPIFII